MHVERKGDHDRLFDLASPISCRTVYYLYYFVKQTPASLSCSKFRESPIGLLRISA